MFPRIFGHEAAGCVALLFLTRLFSSSSSSSLDKLEVAVTKLVTMNRKLQSYVCVSAFKYILLFARIICALLTLVSFSSLVFLFMTFLVLIMLQSLNIVTELLRVLGKVYQISRLGIMSFLYLQENVGNASTASPRKVTCVIC